jgi:hypothetical protein
MSPCGVVMGYCRSLAALPATLIAGEDRTVRVRWYFAKPDALVFPGYQAYDPPWWEGEQATDPGPGVFGQTGNWRSRHYSAAGDGQHFRGQLQWFLTGIPSDQLAARPIADTCIGPAIDSMGGARGGGSGWPVSGFLLQEDYRLLLQENGSGIFIE